MAILDFYDFFFLVLWFIRYLICWIQQQHSDFPFPYIVGSVFYFVILPSSCVCTFASCLCCVSCSLWLVSPVSRYPAVYLVCLCRLVLSHVFRILSSSADCSSCSLALFDPLISSISVSILALPFSFPAVTLLQDKLHDLYLRMARRKVSNKFRF